MDKEVAHVKNRLSLLICICGFAALALASPQVIDRCRYALDLSDDDEEDGESEEDEKE